MDRFWSKVTKTPTCWRWTAACSGRGYGVFKYRGRQDGAHRVSWLLTFGEIPDGLQVLHRCDNRWCVRPDHLFLGTQEDNMQDASRKGRMSRHGGSAFGDRNASRKYPGIRRGEKNGQAKLTRGESREILQLCAQGVTQKDVARIFGVSQTTISLITRGKIWV